MSKKYSVEVDEGLCKGCGLCVDICPAEVFSMDNSYAIADSPERCLGCGRCELFCPDMAITVKSVVDEDEKENEKSARVLVGSKG